MSEESLHQAVCNYLRLQYPKILFNSDMSGVRLTPGQAKKINSLRSSRGWPDIHIPEPRGIYHGLFIELKKEGEKIYKKDGITPISDHISEQIELMEKLYIRGYKVDFCIGFNSAKKMIDEYLKLRV